MCSCCHKHSCVSKTVVNTNSACNKDILCILNVYKVQKSLFKQINCEVCSLTPHVPIVKKTCAPVHSDHKHSALTQWILLLVATRSSNSAFWYTHIPLDHIPSFVPRYIYGYMWYWKTRVYALLQMGNYRVYNCLLFLANNLGWTTARHSHVHCFFFLSRIYFSFFERSLYI